MSDERRLKALIRKKDKEIKEIKNQLDGIMEQAKAKEAELNAAESHKAGLEQALGVVANTDQTIKSDVRPGSQLDKARKALMSHGKPMSADEICRALGKDPTKATKQSITGSIGRLVRDGRVFTRPSPGTFGLIEWEAGSSDEKTDDSIDLNQDQEDDNVRVLRK